MLYYSLALPTVGDGNGSDRSPPSETFHPHSARNGLIRHGRLRQVDRLFNLKGSPDFIEWPQFPDSLNKQPLYMPHGLVTPVNGVAE